MRKGRIRSGMALLLITGVLAVVYWDTVIDLSARPRAAARIQIGMSLQEVEAIMGSKGESPSFDIIGASKRWRWEDAYTAIDVHFNTRSPKESQPLLSYVVIAVVQQEKQPPELGRLWLQRSGFYLLALVGVGFLVRGLLTPKPVDALNSPPTSDTKDSADSPTD
ncbi:MAG: hypothetical protein K8U57_03405 [Planctomycetes bacterium]|nr:hypothetical protein [Planctomycetota bacterium]